MAKLIIDDIEYDLADGASIAEMCKRAGIPFDCNSGICGSCQIKILEGSENLNKLTQDELDLGMDQNRRLSCQCIINSGAVKISY